jgi:hypothetical protein
MPNAFRGLVYGLALPYPKQQTNRFRLRYNPLVDALGKSTGSGSSGKRQLHTLCVIMAESNSHAATGSDDIHQQIR